MLDRDDIGTEPTELAPFSFGQVTMPLMPLRKVTPVARIAAGSIVKPYPRIATPTPVPNTQALPAPMTAPPPSATRGIALGFAIGTTLGLALLGAAWQFFL